MIDCKCGHTFDDHCKKIIFINFPQWRCYQMNPGEGHCRCEGYQLDNLKYLEAKVFECEAREATSTKIK